MNIPSDYFFTEEHEWARDDGDNVVTVGISDHAQDLLGDVVYVELPVEGDAVEAQLDFGVIESVKTASDLYSPVSGQIVEVNEDLMDAPELVNKSPYGEGWMIRVELDDPSELEGLMDAEAYEDFVGEDG